jgi:hypothetical protein
VAGEHLAAHPELGERLPAAAGPVRLVHPRMHEVMEERIVLFREETSRVAAGKQELEARLEEQSRLLAASSARLSELELELQAALHPARDRTGVIRRARGVAAGLPGAQSAARAILPRLWRLRRRLRRDDPDAQAP